MKDENNLFKDEALLASILIRISAMEKILIDKNIISVEGLAAEVYDIAMKLSQTILEKSNTKVDLDKIINDFKNKNKN